MQIPLILTAVSLLLLILLWWAARTWLRPHGSGTVFYDGGCGFCQGWVRRLLTWDRASVLRFAPLHGAAWRESGATVTADSVVVITDDGRTLITWAAVRFLAGALGGPWRVGGWLLAIVPRGLGDFFYDRIAAVRHRLAKKPTGNCPLLTGEARKRFDLRA